MHADTVTSELNMESILKKMILSIMLKNFVSCTFALVC